MAETPLPPARRGLGTADERRTLEAFLDDYRDIVVRKATGLSDADARRRLVPSATTVGGLVKHLRWVEYGWFDQLLTGRLDDNRRPHDRESEFGNSCSPPTITCPRCSPTTAGSASSPG